MEYLTIQQQLEILNRGVNAWNEWRYFKPSHGIHLMGVDFTRRKFEGVNLKDANLSGAVLVGAILTDSDLSFAHLADAKLSGADLMGVTLKGAELNRAELFGAFLNDAQLVGAYFMDAKLVGANLSGADCNMTDFTRADLTNATLHHASFVGTTLRDTNLTNCKVYGLSAWDLNGNPHNQSNLIITPDYQSQITVDDLQLAQFIYLLLNNRNVRKIVETITSKVVLILGNFSDKRKEVLDAVRDELRKLDLTPIIFDFEKPMSKDFTGTVETLARMARFIIADLTGPNSIPHELATIVPFLRTTPVLPIKLKGATGYSMFNDYQSSYSWVLSTHEYLDGTSLIAELARVIAPVNAMANAFRKR